MNTSQLYQQLSSRVRFAGLTSTGIPKGSVRHQETDMGIRNLRQLPNMGVEVTAKGHMGGHLKSTRNLVHQRGEGVN